MITRDNYEEFFLLYVDNELSATDRQLVERFVAGNPDLEEEWEALLQCRVEPEQFIFPGKEELMMKEEEAWPERIFEPDLSIVFPDKESLYRHTKDRRIVFYPWWRIAAAAVLVLIAAGGYFFLSVKKDTSPVTPATAAALYPTENTVKKQQEAKPAPIIKTIKKKTEEIVARTAVKEKAPETRVVEPTTLPQQINRPEEEQAIAAADPQKINVGIARAEKTTEEATKPVTPPEEVISKENSSFASQALLNNSTAVNDEYGTETTPQKKNKLRGIFRRVSRAFEKTADRDDDNQRKVLIGSFQFALK
ncbi:MAG TPA: hypothetical protein VGM30_11460 [Puia sp.]|jgi:hypothetical protein